jgi:lysophospholipase L1-like esterase
MHSAGAVADVVIHCRSLATAAASVLALSAIVFTMSVVATERRDDAYWVASWSASPQASRTPIQINEQTVRQIAHLSLGGERVRVRLSNAYGTSELVIGSAHVAISAGGGSIYSSTDRVLTFNGSPVITIPAGALVVSDPITLNVPALGDVAVSLYLPENVTATTEHTRALQTTYISQPGDFTGEYFFTPSAITQSFYFLTGVEVSASKHARAIVAFGDSETDGLGSTPDTNLRWPNLLAERLQSNPSYSHLAVVAAGVSGNRILNNFVGSNGLSRFDRDALVQTGVKYVIVGHGNVDIIIPAISGLGKTDEVVTVAQLIQAHEQLIDRAHALRLRVYGSTLPPVTGYLGDSGTGSLDDGFWTSEMEEKRLSINQWIRTSQAYDAVLDFDEVLRDPSNPSRLLPAYDSGDRMHPNDDGYQAIADSIDLSLFRDAEN